LNVLRARPGVTLLVTDISMPGTLNGRQLADSARALRPDLRVLFITGHAPAAAIGNLGMNEGMQVLPKPFGLSDLTDRVQQLMQR
jgi:CheY-like chemotaxis protein